MSQNSEYLEAGKMSETFHIDMNVPVEMRDGTILRANIYRPDKGTKHPAIIMRTPYTNDHVFSFSYVKPITTLQAGYALVIAFVRGKCGSEGQYNLAPAQQIEGADCYDTVEWVAAQSWCNGNIGMAGESALGTVQWRTARENPPHLKAIAPSLAGIPGETSPEVTDSPVLLNIAINSLQAFTDELIGKMEARGEDTSEIRRRLKGVENDPATAYNYLPLKELPVFNYPGLQDTWHLMLRLTTPKIKAGPPEPYPFHKIKIPTLNICAWYDPFSRLSLYTFRNVRTKAAPEARPYQHLFAGPWCHHSPTRTLGNMDFGRYANDTGSRAWEYQLSFFDKYLEGKNINLPVVRYFTMGRNTWHEASDWPLPQTAWQRFFLHSRGSANSYTGDGLLSRDEPGQEAADTFIYDPHNPVFTTGGRGAEAENGFVTGPIDQGHVERRPDVLCYTSPELPEEIEITGPLEIHLFASSSCKDTDFTAKLVDVYPNGRAYNIADGIVRAKFRNSMASPEFLKSGEIVEFLLRLGPVSQAFRPGHRIRIDISSSNFPTYDRNMNTGNPVGVDSTGIKARQTVYHQIGYASYIDLPVIAIP
jgi:uncharacterized protein